ncbi:MAG: G8 domain-containing protein, partial [Geminicoccaceae bacterium]
MMTQFSRLSTAASVALVLVIGSSEGFAQESGKDDEIPSVQSAQDGNWSSPATWSGGAVPEAGYAVTIGHAVTYDLDTSRIAGVTIADTGKLAFSPGKSVELETDRNVVNLGELELRPASPDVVHRLRFVDVDESK